MLACGNLLSRDRVPWLSVAPAGIRLPDLVVYENLVVCFFRQILLNLVVLVHYKFFLNFHTIFI